MTNLFELIIKLVLTIPITWWLYKDSRARDSAWFFWILLPLLVVFSPILFTIFGLFIITGIYLITRPKGSLFKCPHCSKSIHEILFICPFCRKNAKKECLQCHEPVPWEASQCPHCKSKAITKE